MIELGVLRAATAAECNKATIDMKRRVYAQIVGEEIRRRRTAIHMTQDALAIRSGVSRFSIGSFENGRSLPDAFEARLLSKALGDDLFQEIERIFLDFFDPPKRRRRRS